MRSFLVVALAFVGAVQAQSQCALNSQAIPSCGASCITSAASKIGCGASDFACQCSSSNNAQIVSLAQGCFISSCTPIAGLVSVQSAASSVCACAATAAANPAGGSSTTSTSSVASTSASLVAGSSSTSAMSQATSSMSGATGVTTPATTSSASLSGSGAMSTTSIGPATTETFSIAGAATPVGSIGGLVAAVLGAIVYL